MPASGHISQIGPRTRSTNSCLDENDEIDDSKFLGCRGHGKCLSSLPDDTNVASGPKEKAKRARRGYFVSKQISELMIFRWKAIY